MAGPVERIPARVWHIPRARRRLYALPEFVGGGIVTIGEANVRQELELAQRWASDRTLTAEQQSYLAYAESYFDLGKFELTALELADLRKSSGDGW
jgi:hypothetical protein